MRRFLPEFATYLFLILMALGFTNIFGDKLNWWYAIYWFGQMS